MNTARLCFVLTFLALRTRLLPKMLLPMKSTSTVPVRQHRFLSLTGHTPVYSRDLRWIPEGIQGQDLGTKTKLTPVSGSNDYRPVHDDILLAKLRPGQVDGVSPAMD